MASIITPGSTYDVLGAHNAEQANAAITKAAMARPGYAEFEDQYNRINSADFPDYMDRYSGMLGDPRDFVGGLPGMGEGSSGPIGAEQLVDFGEGAYELFDQFKPGMEYLAENQGVGEQELSNRLGVASAGMQGNIANQEAQAQRQMGRMGVNPNSGAWQAGAGERALQGAAGLSGLQQGVRTDARTEDWKQRMDAAGIGLNTAALGTDALGKATSSYNDALSAYGGMYGDYISGLSNMGNLTENARQYNYNQAGSLAGAMTGAVPSFQNSQQSAAGLQSMQSMGQQYKPNYQ